MIYIKKEIREVVKRAKDQGYSVWARSANKRLKAPYTTGDLTQSEVLDDWLSNSESEYTHWGGLEKWINEEGVEHIIIGFDPRDKLNKKYRNEHFVATLRCRPSVPSRIVVDVRDRTYHLRSLGDKKPKQTLRMSIIEESVSEVNMNFNIQLGMNFFDTKGVRDILNGLKRDSKVQHIQTLKRILDKSDVKVEDLDMEVLIESLQRLVEMQLIPQELFSYFMTDRTLRILDTIRKEVFENWWSEYNLPEHMWALREVTGASVLEIQGRVSKDGKNDWIQIYGTKGAEEANKVGKR
jgi:hypothetical protein